MVGEIVAGLLLGPSLLGWVAPDVSAWVFRPELPIERPIGDALIPKIFTVIAQLGLIFLLFLVGLEFEGGHVRRHGRAAILISLAGISVPFALGAVLAPQIHPHLEPHPVAGPVSKLGLTLFLGVALSITAMPVLGRIMMELGVTRTRLGAITITAAAVDDAIGWIMLATVAAVVTSDFDPLATLKMIGLTAAFVLGMVVVARPLLVRYFARSMARNGGRLAPNALAVLFVALFLAAVATNLIGIFAVFGAFLLGAVLSDQEELRTAAAAKLHDVVTGFFVPVFFTYTGLRTDITNLTGGAVWLICAAVIAAAVAGKFVGCGLAARLSGFTWREGGIIGAMMNARGLMALIAINLGYELGVVPRSLYAVLVLMALVTTMLTTPLLLRLRRGTEIEGPIARSGFLGPPASTEPKAEEVHP
ncbi:sodium hydrogen exchanger : Sodium/hydrogen exchanger OS=Planctomyces limnophilus (strain ATCC 43296 / DSM 3776 / IFAM 1008 / 290) GN=Plim_2302 PE=4 SV=1: Na_H_Exchanger [Gemmataceae bacterium]|nr:sodium hydrogen exchanger : Sodium/hydrogen exchanger OS=Planctomyces limnophilus (strain ATCC 43296 / DSM 3776 / IFAM 1008 / 290) GN=Plim_2302 PE=4 SV=1: Na_H_Exchanger [Gemmataceae bacterium]VTT99915.1 sodium hydrogen exchanger : Sodium/hydrogen exchanger OS=Planctomyces limnophilus (strain ATCC 43296 / DSM 3776 / IFAM 1008 / 290) GN=Plim_2302 PE=4 SV=1: Na_H_Exchanger [Gemmataceae bacterium]